jgi:hypothetical protein
MKWNNICKQHCYCVSTDMKIVNVAYMCMEVKLETQTLKSEHSVSTDMSMGNTWRLEVGSERI